MFGYHLRDSGSVDQNWGSGISMFNIFPGRINEKDNWEGILQLLHKAVQHLTELVLCCSFLRVLSGKSLPPDSWHLWGQF